MIITPHIGEACGFFDVEKDALKKDRHRYAEMASSTFKAVTVLKSSDTHIVSPTNPQDRFIQNIGSVGLATSGSGDVLAGIIAGLCAQGTEPIVAAIWGVRTFTQRRVTG